MKTMMIILSIICVNIISMSQTQIVIPYIFPIKPGSIEWNNLSTGQEMVDVCQIPDSILKKISTPALAQTCLNYPLFFQHTALNNEQKAIEGMIKRFNGLSELTSRADGLSELIKLYEKMPVDKIDFLQTKAEDIPFKLMYLELLLADNKFIEKASKKDLLNLKTALLNKYDNKLKRRDIYSLYNIRKTLLLGAITSLKLDPLNTQQLEIKQFIDNYDTAKPDELTTISKIITKQ